MNCSYVYFDHTSGKKSPCSHPCYKQENLCVFHSRVVSKKDADFKDALKTLISRMASAPESQIYDFRGFIFPQQDFKRTCFNKDCDFRKAEFHGGVDFRSTDFLAGADFHSAVFNGPTGFHSVQFNGAAHFIGCVFRGRTAFSGSRFHRGARFHGCKFHDFSAWQGSRFDAHAIFQSNTFSHDADFRMALFYRGVDFGKTMFWHRVDFEGARLHEEVTFSDTHIAFLKKLNCRRANMDGVVLHTAQVWENPRLENYSFRNAFLISVNLADKQLIDCDFTGAVFKAVLTLGWKPDWKTISNTKFIYTDYRVEEVPSEFQGKVRRYSPVPESRVPADGSFGLGEHRNFTMADYLKEPFRWNLALNVPAIFRTAVANYLQFFTDFMRVTQGIPVEIRTRLEGTKVRVEFLANSEADLDAVKSSFEEYRQNTGRDFAELRLKISFSEQTTALEQKLFLLEYERQIDSLKTKLSLTQALLEQSQEHAAFLRRLVEAKAEPRKLLLPAEFPQHETQEFVLRADLANYSKAIEGDKQLESAVQQFVARQQAEIEQRTGCNMVNTAGDGFLIVFSDALRLIGVATELENGIRSFKLSKPCSIGGFRFIFGYGNLTCIQIGERREYTGEAIVEAERIDQPMKRFLEQNGRKTSEMWCTKAFRDQVEGKHPNLKFEELPGIELDKGHPGSGPLFQITIV